MLTPRGVDANWRAKIKANPQAWMLDAVKRREEALIREAEQSRSSAAHNLLDNAVEDGARRASSSEPARRLVEAPGARERLDQRRESARGRRDARGLHPRQGRASGCGLPGAAECFDDGGVRLGVGLHAELGSHAQQPRLRTRGVREGA